jgi:hypothetical protein
VPKEGGVEVEAQTEGSPAQDSGEPETAERGERVSLYLKGDRLERLKNTAAALGISLTDLFNMGADSVISIAEGLPSGYYVGGELVHKKAGEAFPARGSANLRPGRPLQ